VVTSSEYRVNIVISSKDQTSKPAKKAASGLEGLTKKALKAAAAYVSLKGAQAAVDLVKFGAGVQRASNSVDSLAASFGQSGQAIVQSMQSASDFTIDRMTAMEAANKAMLLGVAQTPEQFAELANIATKLGRAMGQDAAKSIDDFVVAAGRQSKMIADNLGLTVSATDAQERYAKANNTTVDAMDDAQKKQAFLNEMLRQGSENVARLGDGTTDLATRLEQLSAEAADAKAAVGETLAIELAETADAFEDVGVQLPQTASLLEEVTRAALNQFLGLDALQEGLDGLSDAQRTNQEESTMRNARLADSSELWDQYADAIADATYVEEIQLDLTEESGRAFEQYTQALESAQTASDQATYDAWQHTEAMKAQASAAYDAKIALESFALDAGMAWARYFADVAEQSREHAQAREAMEGVHHSTLAGLAIEGNDKLIAEENRRHAAAIAGLDEEIAKTQELQRQQMAMLLMQQFEDWAKMKQIPADKMLEMRTAIAKEYGLISNEEAQIVDLSVATWEGWAKDFSKSADEVVSDLDANIQLVRDLNASLGELPSEKFIDIIIRQSRAGGSGSEMVPMTPQQRDERGGASTVVVAPVVMDPTMTDTSGQPDYRAIGDAINDGRR